MLAGAGIAGSRDLSSFGAPWWHGHRLGPGGDLALSRQRKRLGDLPGCLGVVAVGMLDNMIKSILIGKSSGMPLILVMLGILGSAFAFGFLGVFIGPTLLTGE